MRRELLLGSLALALTACSVLVSERIAEVRCSEEGHIGPPACDPGEVCAAGRCRACQAREICGDGLDNDCDGRVDQGCADVGQGGSQSGQGGGEAGQGGGEAGQGGEPSGAA